MKQLQDGVPLGTQAKSQPEQTQGTSVIHRKPQEPGYKAAAHGVHVETMGGLSLSSVPRHHRIPERKDVFLSAGNPRLAAAEASDPVTREALPWKTEGPAVTR